MSTPTDVEEGKPTMSITVDASTASATSAVAIPPAPEKAGSETAKTMNSGAKQFTLKLWNLLAGNGWTTDKAAFSKESLGKLGLNALLAYGFVSNVSYITCVIAAWVVFGKSYGVSPLSTGMWKKYLAVYVGFWGFNNVIRPARFALSVVLTPAFEKMVENVQEKTGFKRATATGIVVFLVNVIGTFTYLFGGLALAAAIFRVPLFK
jgi:hypothetical protein